MATISLCMIVKDEEEVLARCLQSVAAAVDEIIIVDTGSADATREIAAGFTDNVYDFAWADDFSAARNYSFSLAHGDFQMWLDADDVLAEEDLQKLIAYKAALHGGVDMVMMKYNAGFDEAGNVTFCYYRERLFNRKRGFRWSDPVHEAIAPQGNVLYSDVAVTHRKARVTDPGRNLRIYEKLLAEGKSLSPRQRFYYARELSYQGRYADAIQNFRQFLDSGEGWTENCVEACRDLAGCYRCLGRGSEELSALTRSFAYGAPRAEICCDLGNHFLGAADFETAIFWFKTAAERPSCEQRGGFVQADCYGYIPYMQLAVCYDRLGDLQTAEKYNELAGKRKPQDAAYLYNRAYFAARRQA